MSFSSLFGERLKKSRKSLGWNQAQAAEISGVSREHWGRCERGESVLGGEVLAALAAHGVDVLYVLTGSTQMAPKSMSADEQLLLESYREAPAALRKAAIAALLSGGAPTGARQSAVGDNAIQIGSVTGKARIKNR